jgi:hypothetical protein
MRLRVILSFVTMAFAYFTAAVWSAPLPSKSRRLVQGGGDPLSDESEI